MKTGSCLGSGRPGFEIRLPEDDRVPQTIRSPDRCVQLCTIKSNKVGIPACCTYNVDQESCEWVNYFKSPQVVKGDQYRSVRCLKGYL